MAMTTLLPKVFDVATTLLFRPRSSVGVRSAASFCPSARMVIAGGADADNAVQRCGVDGVCGQASVNEGDGAVAAGDAIDGAGGCSDGADGAARGEAAREGCCSSANASLIAASVFNTSSIASPLMIDGSARAGAALGAAGRDDAARDAVARGGVACREAACDDAARGTAARGSAARRA